MAEEKNSTKKEEISENKETTTDVKTSGDLGSPKDAETDKTEKTESKSKEKKTVSTDDPQASSDEEQKDADFSSDDPEEKSESKKQNFDEELPDDIKKKLEERKNEKKPPKKGKRKKKEKSRVETGKVFIKATYNNTIIGITDLNGNTLSWSSAGVAGFKGPKKSTSYAASIITKIACMKAKEDYGLKEVSVFVKGVGTGRESAIRAVNANGLNVTSIKDITPIPHNGCRPKKPRRV